MTTSPLLPLPATSDTSDRINLFPPQPTTKPTKMAFPTSEYPPEVLETIEKALTLADYYLEWVEDAMRCWTKPVPRLFPTRRFSQLLLDIDTSTSDEATNRLQLSNFRS